MPKGRHIQPPWAVFLLIEDDTTTSARRGAIGVTRAVGDVRVRLHRIAANGPELLGEESYVAGSLTRAEGRLGKAGIALRLVVAAAKRGIYGTVVAGPSYGCNSHFVAALHARGLPFVLLLRPSSTVASGPTTEQRSVRSLLTGSRWREVRVTVPGAVSKLTYTAAVLATLQGTDGAHTTLFAAQPGSIAEVHRGTLVGLTTLGAARLDQAVVAACWPGFIRRVSRARETSKATAAKQGAMRPKARAELAVRANIALAVRQDELAQLPAASQHLDAARGNLANKRKLNVVELFAGAGGMGLGFLCASAGRSRFDIIFSGEVHPIYAQSLVRNHQAFARMGGGGARVPTQTTAVDLRHTRVHDDAVAIAREAGGADVVIGGPPCQGFSMANRNSRSGANPHNNLVDTFLRYVERLRPKVFLMENVQGILWTPRAGAPRAQLSVVDHLARRFGRAGYVVFPKLLDAAWYGVPQFRSRFFLLGLHSDLGYRADDFGPWGPYPAPTHGPNAARRYVTVREAIADLPRVANGQTESELEYREPTPNLLSANPFLAAMRVNAERGAVTDHVTSRHATYVIDRYRAIPQGGNWEDIADKLTNYSEVSRTHSNIYRRLRWDEPSITIGHYRKSMLVHPSQHRGLSLREAARLQSFPDWYRFAGGSAREAGGLVHKQQQLANAVCPLVTQAIANAILAL